jgi:NitT/TauT family transport system substrate-binding protein
VTLAILGVASCRRPPPSPTLILQREWVANAEFAGDTWAQDISHTKPPLIVVKEGSDTQDPVKEVRSGAAQFGVASSDRILRENEGGADLVVLAAATYRSPVVFLSHPHDQIRSPADFRGHVVGIQTGTNTELVFKSLLRAQNISADQMKVVESGWGTTNFESGVISILAAFDYDEPVQLDMKGVPYAILYPEQFGVHYVGTAYFAKRSFVTTHPELVQAFMNKLVAGWRQALAHPREAIARVKASFHKIDEAKERKSFERGKVYFRGETQLLYATPERWKAMANDLIRSKQLKSFDFDQNVDYRFLERAVHDEQAK